MNFDIDAGPQANPEQRLIMLEDEAERAWDQEPPTTEPQDKIRYVRDYVTRYWSH